MIWWPFNARKLVAQIDTEDVTHQWSGDHSITNLNPDYDLTKT